MADLDRDPLENGDDNSIEEEKPGYEPASFEKRAAAWMGVVYVLMILGIFWYALFFPGRDLPGTFPLFLVPVCVTVVIVTARRLRSGTALGGPVAGGLIIAACAGGTLYGLAMGLPALIAAFAG